MGTLMQDLRYALRMLMKKPGFSFIVVLILALGIGANTAIFSVVNAVLLRPLPYRNPERLVTVFETGSDGKRDVMSYPNFEDYRAQNKVFEHLSAWAAQSVNLTGVERPDRVRGGFVSANFFQLLDVQPALGRTFASGEDKVGGGERVAVLNHELWQKRFGGDPNLIGKSLKLNGEPFTVVGIMPEHFKFPIDEVEIWLPYQYFPPFKPERASYDTFVIGRLKEGVSQQAAQAEMKGIAAQLMQAYPEENRGRAPQLTGLHELLVEDLRHVLLILLGAVGLILLITCANMANLTLARGTARQKEVAVRAALGASRSRLVRQLLTETILLGMMGGILGLLISLWGVDALMSLKPFGGLPGGQTVQADARVLSFAIALSALTGLIFGAVPALKLSKPDLIRTLKEGGRTTGEASGQKRLRGAFVISQVALAIVLLTGTGLLINSFYRVLSVNPGFKPENLLTLEYRLPRNKYKEEAHQWNFHKEVVERVRQVPGVRSAAVVMGLPLSGNGGTTAFVLPERGAPPKGSESKTLINRAGPGYFETIGIQLIKGRAFTEEDKADAPPVVVVNQMMARQSWPNEDPVGKQIQLPEMKITGTVVGVVADAKQYELEEKMMPQVYVAYSQSPHIFATLVVRADVEPMSLAESVRRAIWSVDKDQPVWKVRTVEYLLEQNLGHRRFIMLLMTAFALLALSLTALGIYGVISYSVSQRTHEIGVRMALGAQAFDILKLVVGQGLVLTLIGLGLGLAGAFALTRLINSMLYGVTTTDPLTFIVVSVVLLCVALVASYIPARRAMKVDPMIALRYE
jgi:predicted permease